MGMAPQKLSENIRNLDIRTLYQCLRRQSLIQNSGQNYSKKPVQSMLCRSQEHHDGFQMYDSRDQRLDKRENGNEA